MLLLPLVIYLFNTPKRRNVTHTWLEFADLIDTHYDNLQVRAIGQQIRKIYYKHFTNLTF